MSNYITKGDARMITVRRGGDRGHANHGWLDTNYSFSFANYFDRRYMGFGPLRVINEDRIAAGGGFPTHGHQDMEIITYVLEGALEHRDSMGNGAVLQPGEVQRISAGIGITHSEYNPSQVAPVHLLQIWITPNRRGGVPGYDQRLYPDTVRRGRLCPVVSPDGRDGSIPIQQDATLFVTNLEPGASVVHSLGEGRKGWAQVARGSISLNGETLAAGDGAAISDEMSLSLTGLAGNAEVLLFNLP